MGMEPESFCFNEALHLTTKLKWLVVGFEADYLAKNLELSVECPPWWVFLRDPSPDLRKFRRNPWKTSNG